MDQRADVVIIGAGIAGVSTAYTLAVDRGLSNVVMVDPRPPLTLTSDKSTEAYRNWWPDEAMMSLMTRSIDLLEAMSDLSDNAFGMNRRGYLFVTGDEDTLERMTTQAMKTSGLGGGPLRFEANDGDNRDDGADILDKSDIVRNYPYLTPDTVGALRVRRAGWLDAQQLGVWMLDRARSVGVRLERAEVAGIEVDSGSVTGVALDDGRTIRADVVVDAAGPMAAPIAALAGVELPLHSELHLKVVFKDHRGVVPRDAPMLIWSDPQFVDWTHDERVELDEQGRLELLDELPFFCHGRPEGGPDSPYVVGLWEYDRKVMEPTWPPPIDDLYAEVVIRGLARMLPGLAQYRDAMPEAAVDGGYYTKTRENRPLIGAVGPKGFNVIVGLSGFGIMVAAGAADLLADHILGTATPDYAPAFLPSRYENPAYVASLADLETGQL